MSNKYFPDEELTYNDLYFVCYMIERTARALHQHNQYVVEQIGKEELERQLSIAQTSHCLNPEQVTADWIETYQLQSGAFDITDVNRELATIIPTPTQMGKVYARLIMGSMTENENWADAILRVYRNPLCETIDNYNSSAFYEPSYIQVAALKDGRL